MMARTRQSQTRAKNNRNNRQHSPKTRSIQRPGRMNDEQEILRTADRSGNRKGISSPGRKSAAREDDDRTP
jgi:hypothetical protein